LLTAVRKQLLSSV